MKELPNPTFSLSPVAMPRGRSLLASTRQVTLTLAVILGNLLKLHAPIHFLVSLGDG